MKRRVGRRLRVAGAAVHVRDDGPPAAAGAPIVLLHGLAGSVHWYDRILPLLVDAHRLIRIDLRGHGLTGGSAGLEVPEQAATVAAVLAQLEVSHACIVGHSFGADVALFTAREPGLASSVVVLGQAPDYSYARFPPGNGLLALPVLGPAAHHLAIGPVVRRAARIAFAPGFRQASGFVNPDQIVADHAAMNPAMYPVVLTARRRRLEQQPLDALVADMDVPVLAIHGSQDQMYDCARTLARYTKAGAETAKIAGAGHSPQVERPGKVALRLREFLGTAPE